MTPPADPCFAPIPAEAAGEPDFAEWQRLASAHLLRCIAAQFGLPAPLLADPPPPGHDQARANGQPPG